jgi:outer membrane protein assembly factor BamB
MTDVVPCGPTDGVYAIDARTGQTKWMFETGAIGNVLSVPAIAHQISTITSNNPHFLDRLTGS